MLSSRKKLVKARSLSQPVCSRLDFDHGFAYKTRNQKTIPAAEVPEIMKHFLSGWLFLFLMAVLVPSVFSQTSDSPARIKTREQLGQLLDTVGPKIKVSFRRSEKQPFNFVGVLKDGLINADRMEIVIAVTADQTIGFRIFPQYKGAYINVDKARNSAALMRQLLRLSDRTFLYWGIDETGDVFAAYTFTLESGFPDAALTVVLYSIANLDKYVGEVKPSIDGSTPP
jgi:hypothetical protein